MSQTTTQTQTTQTQPTQIADHESQTDVGDITTSAAAAAADGPPVAATILARESRSQAKNRWCREGIAAEVELRRDAVRRESRDAGLPRHVAVDRSWEVAMAEFPPPGVEPSSPEPISPTPVAVVAAPSSPSEEQVSVPDSAPDSAPETGVSGLGDIPAEWPQLPPNASLQAEVAWVAANRLAVLVRPGEVDLSRALAPAPSYSALDWLDTALTFPAKFADVRIKAAAGVEDEREQVRREKLVIAEIRRLLAEMVDGDAGM